MYHKQCIHDCIRVICQVKNPQHIVFFSTLSLCYCEVTARKIFFETVLFMIQVEMHLLHEREEKLAIQMKIAQIEEEREGAESKRLELEQALEEFVRSTDKKGKLAAVEKKASLEQGTHLQCSCA